VMWLSEAPRGEMFYSRQKAGRVVRYFRKLSMFCKVKFG
jgi:capsular polysaccharide export protein